MDEFTSEDEATEASLSAVNNQLRKVGRAVKNDLAHFAPMVIRCSLKDLVPYDVVRLRKFIDGYRICILKNTFLEGRYSKSSFFLSFTCQYFKKYKKEPKYAFYEIFLMKENSECLLSLLLLKVLFPVKDDTSFSLLLEMLVVFFIVDKYCLCVCVCGTDKGLE